MKKLTYAYLASLAKEPARDHGDVYTDNDGAYGGSELDPRIGLHIHTPTDGWGETEPEKPVHFIFEHEKIAEVYPFAVHFHDWVLDPYTESELHVWVRRLQDANRTIDGYQLVAYKEDPAGFRAAHPEFFQDQVQDQPVSSHNVRARDSLGRFVKTS